jgi:hypothetical protein
MRYEFEGHRRVSDIVGKTLRTNSLRMAEKGGLEEYWRGREIRGASGLETPAGPDRGRQITRPPGAKKR